LEYAKRLPGTNAGARSGPFSPEVWLRSWCGVTAFAHGGTGAGHSAPAGRARGNRPEVATSSASAAITCLLIEATA
jgi:hypothetical protein